MREQAELTISHVPEILAALESTVVEEVADGVVLLARLIDTLDGEQVLHTASRPM